MFTVVPYLKPNIFDKETCSNIEMSKEELWNAIESTKSLLEEEKPVIIKDKLVFNSPLEGEKDMAKSCVKASFQVIEFFGGLIQKGTVLDLGCGIGANSLPLLQKGWDVVGIDRFSEVLEIFKLKASFVGREVFEKKQLTLIQGDVTKEIFKENSFDVVLCIDVLPYVDSKKLKGLMNKIHNCLVPNGHFLGTLFLSSPESALCELLMSKLGGHFYKDENVVPALLKHSGFDIIECSVRPTDQQGTPKCVEFIATKSNL